MQKLSKQEIRLRLKKHPHFRWIHLAWAIGLVLFLAPLFTAQKFHGLLYTGFWLLFVGGFGYAFYLRRNIIKTHAAAPDQ